MWLGRVALERVRRRSLGCVLERVMGTFVRFAAGVRPSVLYNGGGSLTMLVRGSLIFFAARLSGAG
jgi:hypothetical protein